MPLWPRCCCGCGVTITATCGASPVNGATVTILSGATTVASGTTNSSGQVVLAIPSAGTYTVQVSGGTCTATTTTTLALACNGSYTVGCCCPCGTCTGLPSTMTLSYNKVTYLNFVETGSIPESVTLTLSASGCLWEGGPTPDLDNFTASSCTWNDSGPYSWVVSCNATSHKLDLEATGGCGAGGAGACNFPGASATSYGCSPLDIAYSGDYTINEYVDSGGDTVLCRLEDLVITG